MTTIKICGVTQLEQVRSIVELGVNYLGFIQVAASPRYIFPDRLAEITKALPGVEKIGVFRNHSLLEITSIVNNCYLTGIQLHGGESLEFCQQLKLKFPEKLLIKAIGVKEFQDLELAQSYANGVDVILLDAYDPDRGGGTGKNIDWTQLRNFSPPCPWWLAGGINQNNVKQAVEQTKPDGIDLSSGVEDSPGNKNLTKIKAIIREIT